ncbi:molecular chaperone HtpG [Catellatospora sp. TT07R-123]|uniref:HSP90 family protein n=1 Tax=Catellatospora sp. TT07R-123 TaxID=2733863 RepID=UPI001B12F29A|nr:HSP90 family protein [Catellatospora sp. TT07R-123]GHJ47325.1 molecular chaperone HtpG [Catellatospora sp. TT07R-123]
MTEHRTEHRFQVDLRGVVDLLSHHLYASPRVYVRELLQNAADAITARHGTDPDAPAGRVVIEPLPGGALRISDNGIGLTQDEVHTFLASVGRTSKRDDLGFARQDLLGQFGIGLLSCFMVADAIEVVSRSAKGGPAVRWSGFADGRYTVDEGDGAEVGTTVTLRPRPGAEHWLSPAAVRDLASSYAHLLSVDVTVDQVRVTEPQAPWEAAYDDPEQRRAALLDYGARVLGSRPMEVIDLSVPEAGLRGVGFVLASPTAVGQGGHRVYLKRMLLNEDTNKLVPEWAFFVRCVVDTSMLRPTASREALYEDDLLSSVRDALGEQIRDWLLDLSVNHPERLSRFLRVHHLGVKALAVRDDEMLRLVDAWLPFETSHGAMPLRTFRQSRSMIRYVETVDEFRALAAIASAAGTPIVNAGFAYDTQILERLSRVDPQARVRRLDSGELAAKLEPLSPGQQETVAPFLELARAVLRELDCVPLIRQFDPVTVPALYLVSQQARTQDTVRRSIDSADELWSDVLSAFDDVTVEHRPELVLNWRHPLIRKLASYPPGPALRHAVEALYGQALLAGHHPLRAVDTAALNRSFLALLDRAFPTENL